MWVVAKGESNTMKKLMLISTVLIMSHGVFAEELLVPIESKVVEIHMTGRSEELTKAEKRKRKIEQMPLDRRGTCSGAFIDSFGDIITAKHCVEGFDSFEVVTSDHQFYTAQVLAASTVHDLALIHIDKLHTEYFIPANSVQQGDVVYVLGSPLGITNTLSKGIIAHLDGDITLIDCSVLPGNSGGPVFNEQGELVGVVTAGFVVMMGMTHLNITQSIESVWFFVVGVLSHRG